MFIRTFMRMMEMLTGTGTRVRLEGLTVVIGAISFLNYNTITIPITKKNV